MTTSGMSVISESAVEMWIPIAAGVTILSTFSSSAFRMIRMTISRSSSGSSMGTPSLIGWTKYWYSPFSMIGASRSDCRNWSMSPVLGAINKAWRSPGSVDPGGTDRPVAVALAREGRRLRRLLELRLALLQERAHPLALVVRAEQAGPRPALQREPAPLRPVVDRVQRLLRGASRVRRLRGQRSRQFVDPVVERVVRDDLADEADVGRLRGVDPLAEEDQALRRLVADEPREPLGAAPPRNDTQIDLGLPEHGALRGDPEVARQRQLAPAAEGVAVDGRDRRRRERLDRVGDAVAQFGVRLRLRRRQFDHVGDVRPRDERVVARAGQDQRSGARRLGLCERVLDGFERVDGERVQLVRAGDGERRDVAFRVDV